MVNAFCVVLLVCSMTFLGNDNGTSYTFIPSLEETMEKEVEDLQTVLGKIEENMGLTSQIDILALEYREGSLVIDLSSAIKGYGGGNTAEVEVISNLLEWSFNQEKVEQVTLLVDGSIEGFPEGNIVHQWTKEEYLAIK